jgi:uncharacterized protein (TIGR02271 family)
MPFAADERDNVMNDSRPTLQVASEMATVEKRDVVTGTVRVSTKTEAVTELVTAMLEQQQVEVTRMPVDREIDAAPAVRTEGDVTIIPVVEEILVVEKRLVLREELHVRRTVSHQAVEVPVDLRRQHAVIERQVPPNEED